MDERIQVHQLRQFLQTSPLATSDGLQALLKHHLHKSARSDSDRDKIDFLLVQFFSHSGPGHQLDSDVELKTVAEALQPVLDRLEEAVPAWLEPFENLLATARQCSTLNELFNSGILEQGRTLKASAGAEYFVPAAMAAITRFNFLMRRTFFRLMHQDLNAILDGLRELEQRGTAILDCRSAQFSAEEPVQRLRMICQSWKVMFQAEYASGQPLRMLVDLRNVIDSALAGGEEAASSASPGSAQHAMAAAAGLSTTASAVAEFEVSTDPDERGSDDSAGE
jgi:hypothetical protein